ncbi:hypothetical protein DSCA_47740 [Desulfosarcina alkanivorans]|jgi:hypothetical protein|uniref:Uncharacterized protein n=1 Tax=Desulfosarcina alkanivorans TaxID=571177 RepID=A0A5K7YX35_9BACT|nr:hypothetical protein DSCA_47740 [Desulfosarcina alkanivorans]
MLNRLRKRIKGKNNVNTTTPSEMTVVTGRQQSPWRQKEALSGGGKTGPAAKDIENMR